jgi:hypothetical protein
VLNIGWRSQGVAEPVVRNNIRTIIVGPYILYSSSVILALNEYLPPALAHIPSRSWFTHQPKDVDDAVYGTYPYPLPANHHTLIITRRVCQFTSVHTDKDIKYNFLDLIKFPALEKLVVLITRVETIPANPKQHIILKTLNVVKNKHPSFNFPEVEFRRAY